MTPYYEDDMVTLWHGDCRQVMSELGEASVDAIVTDPPYELAFMGKGWDASGIAYDRRVWENAWHVLKPGGHLLAFGGTRTWHRLAVAIEDAGFEIRDNVAYLHDGGLPGPMCWAFGSGFPKSYNVSKALRDKRCECDAVDWPYGPVPTENVRGVRPAVDADDALPVDAEQDVLEGLRGDADLGSQSGGRPVQQEPGADVPGVRQVVSSLADEAARGSSPDVLSPVSGGAIPRRAGSAIGHSVGNTEDEQAGLPHGQESGVEGRRDVQAPEGQLHRPALRPVSAGVSSDGEVGRLRHGAPSSDGAQAGPLPAADGSRQPHKPRPEGQQAGEPGVVPEQRRSQAWGGWPVCRRCGKPSIPDGLGTALKPAFEPIVVARKPLIGTVAENVLAHGTGALNIDGCRIPSDDGFEKAWDKPVSTNIGAGDYVNTSTRQVIDLSANKPTAGRWPANVILDESQAAELDRQSGTLTSGKMMPTHTIAERKVYGQNADGGYVTMKTYGDTGGASRFFYTAKASTDERPRVDGVAHPTVKPLDLMQYLVRLVTPPGGTVLEPFAGSGTTLEACIVEGFKCVGIEITDEYLPLIRQRLSKPIEQVLL